MHFVNIGIIGNADAIAGRCVLFKSGIYAAGIRNLAGAYKESAPGNPAATRS